MAHTPLETLKAQKKVAPIQVNATYQHYKSKELYRVVALGFIESTEKLSVIYHSLTNPDVIWVRPVDEWLASVEHDGVTIARFIPIKQD